MKGTEMLSAGCHLMLAAAALCFALGMYHITTESGA